MKEPGAVDAEADAVVSVPQVVVATDVEALDHVGGQVPLHQSESIFVCVERRKLPLSAVENAMMSEYDSIDGVCRPCVT